MGGRFLCGVAGAISHISIREVVRFLVCESEWLSDLYTFVRIPSYHRICGF